MGASALRARDRRAFILEYLAGHPPAVDVLDAGFVEAYVGATGVASGEQPFGAPSCPMLGRDLSALWKAGALRRVPVGLQGREVGFPAWVYSYSLPCAEGV